MPYYRRVFDDLELRPDAIEGLNDLGKLPFLTKALIRSNTEELKADNGNGLSKFNTGGSTGEPLIFYIGKERVTHDVAAKWRATRWWNVDIGDPEIVVWGSPIELNAQDRLKNLRDKVLRTRLLPAFEMSERNLTRFLEEIRRVQPRMLFGYPTAIALIARHAERMGRRMDHLGIRVAFVTAEKLYEDQRKTIARVFGCSVANGYGGRDAGFVAHECAFGSMHINAEDIVVEVIDQNGDVLPPGQEGEIVVTHLATRDFPFIRYRTGDIGVLDGATCRCGRGLPVLKDVIGRATDFIVGTNGAIVHGLGLIYVLRELPGIEAFKIIQESKTRVKVLLVAGPGFATRTENSIREGFRRRLGAQMQIDVQRVNVISPEVSGKYRHVISRVDH